MNDSRPSLTIIVLGSPENSQGALTALNFAIAAVKCCHIRAVFFNSNGAHIASKLSITPQDERDLNKSWCGFANQHGVKLYSCISASIKRGVLNEHEAKRFNKPCTAYPEFEITGLGTLIELLDKSDRTITFK